jgi:hypothetical protein
LRQLEIDEHLYIPLKETSAAAIRQFCNAVEMRWDTNLLPIAKSLSAALGELPSILELERHALLTKRLIDIYLTLHPSSKIKELPKSHTRKLQEVLKLIDDNKYDIVLLEPLNSKLDDYCPDLEEIDVLAEIFPQKNAEYDLTSWILQQVDHLEELTDQSILFIENTRSIKERFQQIKLNLGE